MSDITKYKQELIDAINRKDASQVQQSLLDVRHEGEILLFQRDVLKSLRYEELPWRWAKIDDAGNGTYDWIFDEHHCGSQLRFSAWLKRETGVYWITGNAGSGKSTLMKHISNHEHTNTALLQWANGRPLLTGSHYFWYLGTSMQKSYEGMLQSVLYEVLRKQPELIESVCAHRKTNDSVDREAQSAHWTLPELRKSMKALSDPNVKLNGKQICFCFFIDGLDEYDGDHELIIRLLQDLAHSDNVKICASSRPWEVFHESFGQSKQLNNSLMLHLHNKYDIEKIVHQELDPYLALRRKDTSGLDLLVAEIVDKAQGVFLWVALVIKKELKYGILHADTVVALRERLKGIPPDLESYFQMIFDRIDPFYRQDTARIFQACIDANEPLPCNVVPLLIDDNPSSIALASENQTGYDWFQEEMLEDIRKQVNGRCQDLLFVEPPTRDSFDGFSGNLHRIQFLHRSVQDYLRQGPLWDVLRQRAGRAYRSEFTLLAAYVFLLMKGRQSLPFLTFAQAWLWSNMAFSFAAKVHDSEVAQQLIAAVDRIMRTHASAGVHWTNLCILPGSFPENGKRDLLAHMIEICLLSHVAARMNARDFIPTQAFAKKSSEGRPYLDYALRCPHRNLIAWVADKKPQGGALVRLLLSKGANVNEKVKTLNDLTVWQLYLNYLFDVWNKGKSDARDTITAYDQEITWILINGGAQDVQLERASYLGRYLVSSDALSADYKSDTAGVLRLIFGDSIGCAMIEVLRK